MGKCKVGVERDLEREMGKNDEKAHGDHHILVLPYTLQGHINPMVQFSKRLASKGVKITLAITHYVAKSMEAARMGPIKIETISDGYDDGGRSSASSAEAYLESFETVGSRTLAELIKRHQSSGSPVSCVVYDSFLPWVLEVTQKLNLIGAVFFTQSLAVTSIYYYVNRGLVTIPVPDQIVSVPGLPPLEVSDLPSFVSNVESYPFFLRLLVNQFSNIDKADWVLFNTFDKLEPEVLNWMAKLWPVRTIGPTIPSMFLDKRIEGDKDYGLNIFETKGTECIDWLNTKKNNSVIYVSFGSMAVLGTEQTEEIAWALLGCNYHFLWVVREKEKNKIPSKFSEEISSEKGLVVTWCPQLEVLSHQAVGCFVTHCGWNSTLEALSLGVPMIDFPQWSDQPTNAKCLEDLWRVGIKPKVDEDGILRKKEIELCIREAIEGDKGKEMRQNASTWKELAKEAVNEGGSSDNNIKKFIAKVKVEAQITPSSKPQDAPLLQSYQQPQPL